MLGQRLKSERERVGMTQPDFAAIAGVGKTTVINWEKDVSSPTAVQLLAFLEAGVDVIYVITGEHGRQQQSHQISDSVRPYDLSADEAALLAAYRRSPPPIREAALRMLDAAVPPAGTMPEGLQMKKPVDGEIPAVMRSGTPADVRRSSRKKKGGDG